MFLFVYHRTIVVGISAPALPTPAGGGAEAPALPADASGGASVPFDALTLFISISPSALMRDLLSALDGRFIEEGATSPGATAEADGVLEAPDLGGMSGRGAPSPGATG